MTPINTVTKCMDRSSAIFNSKIVLVLDAGWSVHLSNYNNIYNISCISQYILEHLSPYSVLIVKLTLVYMLRTTSLMLLKYFTLKLEIRPS